MKSSSVIRQQVVLWSLVLGLWSLLVVAFAGQLVFINSLPWTQALTFSVRDWFPWVFLAPAVAWLAFRFPLEGRRLSLSIPVHVFACMMAVLICEYIPRPVGPPPEPPRGRPPGLSRGEPDSAKARGPRNEPRPGEDLAGMPARPPGKQPPFPRHDTLPFFLNNLLARAQFNIPIYWVIVSLVHAFTYYRRSQERELKAVELEARLADAKLEALRMQLHPHFLFNTLNAISTLVHRDPAAADEMIGNLSELLRASLDTTQQEIPLGQELALLDHYLAIQQSRFGGRLTIEKQVESVSLPALVPTLLLQPLVENAIRHGIEPEPSAGRIDIQAGVKDGILELRIRNSGPKVKIPADSAIGIGLANSRGRLRELYAEAARLEMKPSPEGGCSVEVALPYHENPRADHR